MSSSSDSHGNGTVDTNSVTWNVGMVSPGWSENFSITLDSNQFQQDSVTWTVTSDYDPDPINDTTQITLNRDQIFYGCTDPVANNYDPMATHDDATCTYPETDLYITANPAYANQMENNA